MELVLISLSLAAPSVSPGAANPDPTAPAQGPTCSTPAPGSSGLEQEAGMLQGHPSTELPSQPTESPSATSQPLTNNPGGRP